MLKLKHGEAIKRRGGSSYIYYVVDVLENSVLVNTQSDFKGTNHWYSNEYFVALFNYKEPFEPEEGDCVWFLEGTTPTVVQGLFSNKKSYLFNRIFKTEAEANEFCAKVNAL